MSIQFRKHLKRAALVVVTLFSLGGMNSFAAPPDPADIPDSACDPNYMGTLKSRAWLEAQREITQNQNLILKPDSVFEYTCYDQFLNELAKNAKTLFSDSNNWQTKPQPTMPGALDRLVGAPLRDYLSQNYGDYPLLGGRAKQDKEGGKPGEKEDLKYTPSNILNDPDRLAAASYSCDMMNKVWKAAKCMGFFDKPEQDGFFGFEHYRDELDPRALPPGSGCGQVAEWATELSAVFETDPAEGGTLWSEDAVKPSYKFFEDAPASSPSAPFLGPLLSGDDGPDCSKSPKFSTNVEVYRSDPYNYIEHVCLFYGCYYGPNTDTCLSYGSEDRYIGPIPEGENIPVIGQ